MVRVWVYFEYSTNRICLLIAYGAWIKEMIQEWCSLSALATGRMELAFTAMKNVFILEKVEKIRYPYLDIEVVMMPSY